MSHEPSYNIGHTCADHAPRPNLMWTAKKPEFFVGLFVKKGFETDHPSLKREHMWIEVKRVENGKLVGELNNDPIHCPNLKCGDQVVLDLEEIEMVFDGKRELEP